MVDAKGVVQQVTNYYPFGAPYVDATAVKCDSLQPYKYNGKELDLMHGLNTYDYGARQHDPILCRWDRIDPLCEKYYPYSPYNYCVNNPVSYIDMDGMEPNGNGWGKALGVAEMVGGALIAAVGVVATGAGVVAELPTLGGSTVITVSGGSMTLAGCGLMATGLTTWNMASNDNSYSSSSNVSSSSSSSTSTSSTPSPQNGNEKKPKTYQTYTKKNEKTGEVYTGRTSGRGTPQQNVANRDKNHHMNDKGFGPAKLDKSSSNYAAIRGREQQGIEGNGGAKSTKGTSGNSINGISQKNPKKDYYMQECIKEFGK